MQLGFLIQERREEFERQMLARGFKVVKFDPKTCECREHAVLYVEAKHAKGMVNLFTLFNAQLDDEYDEDTINREFAGLPDEFLEVAEKTPSKGGFDVEAAIEVALAQMKHLPPEAEGKLVLVVKGRIVIHDPARNAHLN